MSNLAKYLLIAPLLAACAQTDAEPTPQTSPVVSASVAPDLARPQPEMPVCGHCGADIGFAPVPNDDELSMIINSEYVGDIEAVALAVYTATGKYTVNLAQWVVDDLNNTSTYETIIMLDIPDAEAAVLQFTLDDESVRLEPITVES